MTELKIGVFGLQGAIAEHEAAIKNAGDELGISIDIKRVSLPHEIENIDGLVMPGGESTAMTLIGKQNGMLEAVSNKISEETPVFGTCAGAILLSKSVRRNKNSPINNGVFPYLDIEILRNGYGRQRESFSTELKIEGLDEAFHGIFIRAPIIGKTSHEVEILGELGGDPVMVKQGNIIATSFHPELSDDLRIHKLFLQLVMKHKYG